MLRFLLLILLAAPLAAAPPDPAVIKLPVNPVQPQPTPSAATKLNAGARYVVEAKVECDIILFPEGLVEVQEKSGPRDWTGIFSGGTGDYEDKTFSEQFLYALKAKSTGTVKVVFIPRGYKDKSQWVTAVIDVDAGKGPQPPPPGPEPKPEPNPGPTAKAVYMAVIRDSAAITPKIAGLLGDTPFWNSFKTAGHEWDFYDDTPTDDAGRDTEAKKKGYLRLADRVQTAGQPFVPTLILLNKDTGDILKVIPLPADKTGVQTAVKEVTK